MTKMTKRVLAVALSVSMVFGSVELSNLLNNKFMAATVNDKSLETFANEVSDFYAENDISHMAEDITISKDITVVFDDTIMVPVEKVTENTDIEISDIKKDVIIQDNQELVAIDDIAKNTDYEVIQENEDIVLSKIYQSKTLIVKSPVQIDTYGASDVISGYGDLYILKYDTEEDTKKAYDKFLKNNNINSVEIDSIISAETLETLSEETTETAIESLSTEDTTETVMEEVSETTTEINENTEISKTEETSVSEENSEEISSESIMTEENTVEQEEETIAIPEGVIVAVLDSGVDKNNSLFKDKIIDLGLNLSTSGEGIQDDNGHGTAVASVIAKNSNATLLPIKIANSDGKGTVLSLYLAIQTAIENDVDIINLSLTTAPNSDLLTSIIEEANEKGILVVAAAGNQSANVENYTPANIDSVIAVASANQDYSVAEYSNYGNLIDYSAVGTDVEVESLNGTTTMTGTSLSAAYVTSVIATILSEDENANVKTELSKYSYDLGEEGKDIFYGNGVISLEKINISEKELTMPEISESKEADWIFVAEDGTIYDKNTISLEAAYTTGGITYTYSSNTLTLTGSGTVTNAWQTYNTTWAGYVTKVKTIKFNSTGITGANANAFTGCTALTTVNIANSGWNNKTGNITCFKGVTTITTVTVGTGGKLCPNMFQNCTGITKATVDTTTSAGITEIPNYCFDGCTSLKGFTANSGLYYGFGDYSFRNCTSLATLAINVSNSYHPSIGNYAFYGCTSLTNIRNSTANYTCTNSSCSPTSTTAHSVSGCTGTISDHRYKLRNNVTTIGDYAFYNCTSLAKLNLGTGVTTIGYNSFRGTTPLTTLTVNSNIQNHNNAFKGHTGIQTLILNSSCTILYNNMFENCTALSKVDISGTNITTIGDYVFCNCPKLNTKNAFDYTSFDASLTSVGKYAFRFGGFTTLGSAGYPTVSVTQSVSQVTNYYPNSGGVGKVTMTISAESAQSEEGKDYIIIMDTTGSMTDAEYQPQVLKDASTNKMAIAKDAIAEFIDTVQAENSNNRIAIINYYGTDGYCYIDFTNDFSTLKTKVSNLKKNSSGASLCSYTSGTNYRSGLVAALKLLQMRGASSSTTSSSVTYGASGGANRNTYAVFISDGAPTQDKSYIQPMAKVLKGAVDGVWSIGICVEDSGEDPTYLQNINTTLNGQNLYIDFPAADLKQAMSDFLKQVVSISTSSIYSVKLNSVVNTSIWDIQTSSSTYPWSSGVTYSGNTVYVNIDSVSDDTLSYSYYVKLKSSYKNGLTTYGTFNPIVTQSVYADYTISGGKYDGKSSSVSNTTSHTLPWYTKQLIINPNGGCWNGSTSNSTYARSYGVTQNIANPTRTGYTFTSWSKSGGGSLSGSTYTYSTTDGTLTANWTINSSTLKVNPNGGTWNGSTSTQSFTGNYNTTKSIPVPTRTGYTFTGWTRTNTYGTLSSTTAAATYTYGATNSVTDTITANWRINTYTITYNGNGSTSGTTASQTKNYGTSVNISSNGFVRPGYTFTGWNTKADGSGTPYTVGTAYSTNANLTLYAQWKLAKIDVPVTITWVDKHNEYASRPKQVALRLMNGTKIVKEAKIVTGNNSSPASTNIWTYKFEGVDIYDSNGKEIQYTVVEGAYKKDGTFVANVVPSLSSQVEYKTPVYGGDNSGLTVENNLSNKTIPEQKDSTKDYGVTISGTVTWKDENDKYHFRPDSVIVELYQDGKLYDSIELTDGTTDYKFTDLPMMDNSFKKYTYTVKEKDIDNYVITYKSDSKTTAVEDDFGNTVTTTTYTVDITNTFTPDKKTERFSDNQFTLQATFLSENGNVATESDFKKVQLDKEDVNTTIVLKQLNLSWKPVNTEEGKYNETYSGYSGNEINLILHGTDRTYVNFIPYGKYEIAVQNNNNFTIKDIEELATENVIFSYENGKYYVTYSYQYEEAKEDLNVNMTLKSWRGYTSKMGINNYFKINN